MLNVNGYTNRKPRQDPDLAAVFTNPKAATAPIDTMGLLNNLSGFEKIPSIDIGTGLAQQTAPGAEPAPIPSLWDGGESNPYSKLIETIWKSPVGDINAKTKKPPLMSFGMTS